MARTLVPLKIQQTKDRQTNDLQKTAASAIQQVRTQLGYQLVYQAVAGDPPVSTTPAWNQAVDTLTSTVKPSSRCILRSIQFAFKAGDVIDVDVRLCTVISNNAGITAYVGITDGNQTIVCPGLYVNWGGATSYPYVNFLFNMSDSYTLVNKMDPTTCTIALYGTGTGGTVQFMSNSVLRVKAWRQLNT